MAQRKSNTEFVTDLMEMARSGPLMQAFVIEALRHYAEVTSNAGPWETITFIDQDAWKACATEVLAKLEARSKS